MKKLLNNISKARIVAVAVIAVAVLAAFFWVGHTAHNSTVSIGSDKKIDITPEQIRST